MGRSYARAWQVAVVTLGLLLVGTAANAQGRSTPAEEDWCNGLRGALKGLCTAYCEAMDCESENPNASSKACNSVLENYMRKSGGESPPCFETFVGYCAENSDSNCCLARDAETDEDAMGCEDPQCESTVCFGDVRDLYCCVGEWDQLCVNEADQFCASEP